MSKLAIEGGEPIRKTPFPPRIQIGSEELQAVMELMKAATVGPLNFDRYANLGGGVHVNAFEREFAEYYGARFATATSSGTGAIHAGIGALRLDIGSEIITSPITDPGAVASILLQNCIPVFADTDPETFNLDPASFEKRISDKTKAIIATHLAGQPCDMDPIMEIAEKHDIIVIEDCSQAHDALYKGKKAGTIGHIGAFSLMSLKHITAGGQGGMVITDNEEFCRNTKGFADRGKSFASSPPEYMFLGNNYRMTELCATMGRVQLKKLPRIVEARRKIVARIEKDIRDLEAVRLGKIIEGAVSSYWYVFLRVYQSKLSVSKENFGKALAAEGIPVIDRPKKLIIEQPWIRNSQTYGQSKCPWCCPFWGKKIDYEGSCPNARKAIDTHIALEVHECYTAKEADDIATALRKVEARYKI